MVFMMTLCVTLAFANNAIQVCLTSAPQSLIKQRVHINVFATTSSQSAYLKSKRKNAKTVSHKKSVPNTAHNVNSATAYSASWA